VRALARSILGTIGENGCFVEVISLILKLVKISIGV
jgi:hexokinase